MIFITETHSGFRLVLGCDGGIERCVVALSSLPPHPEGNRRTRLFYHLDLMVHYLHRHLIRFCLFISPLPFFLSFSLSCSLDPVQDVRYAL